MLNIIIMIVAGLIAAMGLILKYMPKSKAAFDKIDPFVGFIGLFLIVWSVIAVIRLLSYGVFPIVGLILIIVQFLVGFLLSFGLLAKLAFKSEKAKAKSSHLRNTLVNIQIPLGLVLVGYGIWSLVRKTL